jgi:hypothetical protein
MKDSIRRLILFTAIVGLGSVLIFANLPLIYMLPLVVVVGFVLLIALGAVTIAEIKASFAKFSLKNLRQRLNSLQIGGKKTAVPSPKEAVDKKPVKSSAAKITEKTGGIKGHLSLLASSIGSLKNILSERKKPVKKPEEINKLLDRTISEKVSRGSALESAAAVPTASGSEGGCGGGVPAEKANDSDPFLSLSGEDLETGLLDSLDDAELDGLSAAPSESAPAGVGGADTSADLSMPDLDMPDLPDSDTNAEADAILQAHAEPGPEEFENLEGGDAIDENLGDLDNINLDDIDLGDDIATSEPAAAAPVSEAALGAAPPSGNLIPATPLTPAAEPDSSTDQSDISSFAAGSGPGSDDDMLSSLASDIKQVKKEKDVSLLRELKDFRAPAADIEQELQDMAGQLDTASDKQKKKKAPVQGLK